MEDNTTYELTLLINPDLTEFDVQKVIDKIKKYIGSNKGEVIKEHSWGKKQLAYPINKAKFGYYHTIIFNAPREIINDFIRELQLNPEVFRYLNLSLDKEGITVDQLFSPEKEEAMISSAVKDKMMPSQAEAKKTEPVVKPKIEKKVEKPVDPEKLDQKIDELLKDDIK